MDDVQSNGELIACPHCDALQKLPELDVGQKAVCIQCDHTLSYSIHESLERPLACSIAGTILLILSVSFPFLSFEASGREQSISLMQSSLELYRHGHSVLSLLSLAFIVLVPATMLVAIMALLGPLMFKKRPVAGEALASTIFMLSPWAMVDVFLLGVLISLTKIAELANLIIGTSFWSFLLFALVFAATIASLDKRTIWKRLESVSNV